MNANEAKREELLADDLRSLVELRMQRLVTANLQLKRELAEARSQLVEQASAHEAAIAELTKGGGHG